MLDLKVLLNHVFDGEKLNDDDVAGVISSIDTFRKRRDG